MAKKPNILYILSDDQGAWAMHCAGNPEIHTPNLDRLAERGIRTEVILKADIRPGHTNTMTSKVAKIDAILD